MKQSILAAHPKMMKKNAKDSKLHKGSLRPNPGLERASRRDWWAKGRKWVALMRRWGCAAEWGKGRDAGGWMLNHQMQAGRLTGSGWTAGREKPWPVQAAWKIWQSDGIHSGAVFVLATILYNIKIPTHKLIQTNGFHFLAIFTPEASLLSNKNLSPNSSHLLI